MNQDVVHARSVRAVQVLCRLRTSRPHGEFLRRVVRKSPRHLGDSSGAPEDLRRDVPSPHWSPESDSRIPVSIGRNTTCSPDRYRENSAIDYCEACGGYLKTYDGEGNESVLLADWTSLHLDILARDRGLKRRAASLYDL